MYLYLKKTACAALLPFLPCVLFAQAPNIQWQNTVGGSSYEFLNTIAYTSDSGVIAGGYSESNISGDKTEDNLGCDDYWIVKLDTSGKVLCENTVRGVFENIISCLHQSKD